MSNKHGIAATTISEGVNSLRTESQANQSTSQKTYNKTNLNYIAAATAMYRAQNSSQENVYTPSEEHKKTFTEAQKNIANLRGIVPNETGAFNEEHLQNELSPLEVLKQYSFEHYRENKNNKDSFNEINQIYNDIYENEENSKKEQVPEQLNSLNSQLQNKTFLTDNDFLASSDKEKEEYIKSLEDFGAEKDRLTNLLKEKSTENNKNKIAPELKRSDLDPDGPSIGDKDYKSSQKDIIDYMMEIILKGIDYIGNRAIDFTSCTIFGLPYQLYRKNKERDKSTKDDTKNKKQKDQPTTYEQMLNNYQQLRENFQNIINESYNPNSTHNNFAGHIEGFLNHTISIENDGLYKDGAKLNTGETTSNPDTLKTLKELQEQLDNNVFDILNKKLNPNDNNEIRSALQEWIKKTNENNERKAKNEAVQPVEIPNELKISESTLTDEHNNIKNHVLAIYKLHPIKEKIEASANLFATNYMMYKLIEDARSSGKNKKTPIEEKTIKEKGDLYIHEGLQIIYKNYQNLLSNKENTPSPEEMIQLSELMLEKSKKLFNSNDKKTKSENLITEKTSSQKDSSTSETLTDFLTNLTFNDYITMEKENLKILKEEENILTAEQNENNTRRERINRLKKQQNTREASVKNLEDFIQKTGKQKDIAK